MFPLRIYAIKRICDFFSLHLDIGFMVNVRIKGTL